MDQDRPAIGDASWSIIVPLSVIRYPLSVIRYPGSVIDLVVLGFDIRDVFRLWIPGSNRAITRL